jgi:hypothetical protein
MNLATASLLALIGTTLLAVLTVAGLVTDLLAFSRGLLGTRVLVSSFVQAFAAVSLSVFFFVFLRLRP